MLLQSKLKLATLLLNHGWVAGHGHKTKAEGQLPFSNLLNPVIITSRMQMG
jgi:hypothetical protein